MTEHPIIPPPELVQQWSNVTGYDQPVIDNWVTIATQAARWGADQELEACVEWLQDPDLNVDTYKLRAARRPKPPSLKQQALKELEWVGKNLKMPLLNQCEAIYTIRRALEQLDD